MGCMLCNLIYCEEFLQGSDPPIKNPFYCETDLGKEEFLNELIHDIVFQHFELVLEEMKIRDG